MREHLWLFASLATCEVTGKRTQQDDTHDELQGDQQGAYTITYIPLPTDKLTCNVPLDEQLDTSKKY